MVPIIFPKCMICYEDIKEPVNKIQLHNIVSTGYDVNMVCCRKCYNEVRSAIGDIMLNKICKDGSTLL